MKQALFAVVLVLMSFAAFAAEDKMFFHSSDKCVTAVNNGTALPYSPVLNRPLSEKGGWKLQPSKSECVLTDSAQGKLWVYLAEGSSVGEKGSEAKLWKCSNKIYTRVAVQGPSSQAERPQTTTASLDLSKIQTIGGERCHLVSDGTAKLKTTGAVIAKGQKITEPVMRNTLPNGETCQDWRNRMHKELVTNPTHVVQM